MQPSHHHLLLAAAVIALGGCTSKPTLRVDAERSPAANFSTYRTYAWITEQTEELFDRPRAAPDLLRWRIRTAIEKQMAARGYDEVAPGRADLSIAFHVKQRDAHTGSVGDFIRYRESGGQEGMQEAYTFGYQEGTIIIEVLDASTKRLVWRSSAGPIVNPETQQEKVAEAVDSMMARFPAH